MRVTHDTSVFDFVDLCDSRIWEVHLYERETDRHYPPRDMNILGPIVDRLLDTQCRWWTIELNDYGDALYTRALLVDYLADQPPSASEGKRI